MCESLSGCLSLCFSVEYFCAAKNHDIMNHESWYYAVVPHRFAYLELLAQCSLY